MKRILLLICILIASVQITEAQSWKNLFNKKNISRVASSAGVNVPLKIEGTWSYLGTAIELKTDNTLKKAAAEMAAIAAEEKVNEQLANLGIKKGLMTFTFKENGEMSINAMNKNLPAHYELSEDKKSIKLSFTQLISFNAEVSHTIETMSLLFEADKLMQLITYLSEQSQNTSMQAISSLAKNYDGMKIGLQLEKKK